MGASGLEVHCLNKTCNFFIVVNDGELTLIDTGSKDSIENLRAKFARTGYRLEQLKRIIITHCHTDHTGSLAILKQATGAQVMTHEAEAPFVTQEAILPRARGWAWLLHSITEPIFRPERCDVDITLKHGDTIEDTGLTLIHMPGHSPGSICLYHKEARALFTGDTFVNIGKIRGPITAFCLNPKQARHSLAQLRELDIEAIYFAHGGIVKQGGNEKIRALTERLKV